MLLCFFIETECKLSSIRNQTPEHPSNFDTHQNTFCGTEENISLASSECANIPIPYLLLLMRIEKKNYTEWEKGVLKWESWHSSDTHKSIFVQNLPTITLHMNQAMPELLQSGKELVYGIVAQATGRVSLPHPFTKGHPRLAGQDELTSVSSMSWKGCATDTSYTPICLLPDRLLQLGRHYKSAVVVQGETAYTGYPSAPK